MGLEFHYNPADFKSLGASVTGKSFHDLIRNISSHTEAPPEDLFSGEIHSPEFINQLEKYANRVTDPLQKQRVILFSVCVNLLPELVGKIAYMINKPDLLYTVGKIDVKNPIDRLKGDISFGQYKQVNIKEIINQVLKPDSNPTRQKPAAFLEKLIAEKFKITKELQEGEISTVVFDKTLNDLQRGLTSFLQRFDDTKLDDIIKGRLHHISALNHSTMDKLLDQYYTSQSEPISKTHLHLDTPSDRKKLMHILFLCALDTIHDNRFSDKEMTYASSTLTWGRIYDFSLEIIVMPGRSYNIRIAYEVRNPAGTDRAYTDFLTRDSPPVFEADLYRFVQDRFTKMENALVKFAGLAGQTIELANMRFTRNIRIARPPVYRPAARRARPPAPADRAPGPAGPPVPPP